MVKAHLARLRTSQFEQLRIQNGKPSCLLIVEAMTIGKALSKSWRLSPLLALLFLYHRVVEQ
jgi:hypothetical protein